MEQARNGDGSAVLLMSQLKPSSNQVAGHSFEEGHVGSLVDGSGYFYKPLQGGERGEREIKFYEKFWSDQNIPAEIKEYFPGYRGCVLATPPNETHPMKFAVLEDLTKDFEHPCIIDIKMGFQTWYPEAGEAYIKKTMKKDLESTTSTLGIRISGMQVYDQQTHSKWKADRDWCRKLNDSGVSYALRRFVSRHPFNEESPDSSLASRVYPAASIELQKLLNWFEKQRGYHFFSSSVLIIYEEKGEEIKVSVKLVDFAHVTYDHTHIDESYVRAIKSLLNLLSLVCEAKQ